MTTIAIYKPYKPILFNDEEDTASWSAEIVNFIKIFANKGYKICILSQTDYIDDIDNVKKFDFTKIDRMHVDYLVVFNGVFNKDIITEKELFEKIRAEKSYLFVTDLDLAIKYHDFSLYHKLIAQGTFKLEKNGVFFNFEYGHLEKLWLFGKQQLFEDSKSWINRENDLIFFGSERDRLDEILEFIMRPDTQWFGKSDTFNFKCLLTKSQLKQMLLQNKFTIVISDKLYRQYGFVTQRYWEGLCHNMVTFVSHLHDKNKLHLNENNFRHVKNYIELYNKMQQLQNNDELVLSILNDQHKELLPEYFTGEFQFNILKKYFK